MIKPTIGRQVWYYAGSVPDISSQALSDQPFAATVVHVNEDETINVLVLDHIGKSHFVSGCPLVQNLTSCDINAVCAYCTWMPYQVAQAEKDAAIPGDAVVGTTSKGKK